jgi:tRNA-2-methylthio-N6-dimethylallyladenosine synthase
MKYYLWILGCAMNYSDAERISSVLDSIGYKKVENEDDADIFIVVSCSVRQSAVNRIYGKIKDLKEIKTKRPFISVLSGCILKEDYKKLEKAFDIIFKIDDLEKLPELISQKTQNSTKESSDYLQIKPSYDSNFRAFVPISTGCNNFCTYCAVPYTRGREKSRLPEEVINEINELVKNGYKEITLLGQNVNSYGHDFGDKKDNSPFIDLLRNIDKINGKFRIYFYSNHPKDMTNDLINILPKLKHFPAYIHLPLQSGNDEVIKRMNRHYTKEEYLELTDKIKKALPNVTFTTDIIVGFPGETKKQFKDTKDVMEKVGYDMAFIAQYSPRPGTISAKLEDNISKEEKRKREDILQKVLSETALKNNIKLVGKKLEVLIDGQKKNQIYGRTNGFKIVEILSNDAVKVGEFINIEVTSATPWKLKGKIL